MNISKKAAVLFGILGLTAGTAGTIALQTSAATSTNTTQTSASRPERGTPPAALGQVTAISGSTLTINDKRSGTTYSVDISNATIEKISAPSASSTSDNETRPTPKTIAATDIAVGDNIMVEGTVSGANITATKVMDGLMTGDHGGFGRGGHGTAGTVSAINGSTITLTDKNGGTYTINAGSATVKKVSTASVSDISVGDALMVNGDVSGSTINAKNIMDGQMENPD